MEREALKLALEALEFDGFTPHDATHRHYTITAITAIKTALTQPVQEEKKMYVDRIMCGVSRAEWHDRAWELYQAKAFDDCMLPKNVSIHTLRTIFNATYDSFGKDAMKEALAQPAQREALYGMNQDDWKDVVAAIAKVRDGRGVYLGCRPADVFQDWFLALGTAKVKEKNT